MPKNFVDVIKEARDLASQFDYKDLVTNSPHKAIEYAQTIHLGGLASFNKLPVTELAQIIKADRFKNENFQQVVNLYKKSKAAFPELSFETLIKIQNECQYDAISHGVPLTEALKIQICEESQNFIGHCDNEDC